MNRLTSDFFVSAYLRRCAGEGIPAVLRRRGAFDAGAIFIKIDHLVGTASLYAPAPSSADLPPHFDRLFTRVLSRVGEADVEARMAREMKFDSDLWLVEIEERGERHGLDGAILA